MIHRFLISAFFFSLINNRISFFFFGVRSVGMIRRFLPEFRPIPFAELAEREFIATQAALARCVVLWCAVVWCDLLCCVPLMFSCCWALHSASLSSQGYLAGDVIWSVCMCMYVCVCVCVCVCDVLCSMVFSLPSLQSASLSPHRPRWRGLQCHCALICLS